jgi:hypothetical protein
MNRAKHISGFILFLISISLQIYFIVSILRETHNSIIFVLFIPAFFGLSSFFVFFAINIGYNILVPLPWIQTDSYYLSYNKSNNIFDKTSQETILTIQIPVYTESFDSVLRETFENALELAREYNKIHNTTINVFINDDGLFVVNENERNKRLTYYSNNQNELFFIARPKENRAGKFKKASNMNFCLNIIENLRPNSLLFLSNFFNFEFSSNIETMKLGKYIFLLDSDSRIRMTNNENLLDSLIKEMEFDPAIGYLQLKTNARTLDRSLMSPWENTISHFTDNIYDICFYTSCSNGYLSPLIGHNCILNWDIIREKLFIPVESQVIYESENISVQQLDNSSVSSLASSSLVSSLSSSLASSSLVSSLSSSLASSSLVSSSLTSYSLASFSSKKYFYSIFSDFTYDIENQKSHVFSKKEYWRENKVSEDFALSLDFQLQGYYGKYIFYDCGMTEGVSLNIHDELNKFTKYAYGVNEILFHPLSQWYNIGILNQQFCEFIVSNRISLSTKYVILSYMSSYYALSLSPLLSIVNYFLVGWEDGNRLIQKTNVSFKIFISCIVLFMGGSTLSNILFKLKQQKTPPFDIIKNEIIYGFILNIFFSGMPLHLLEIQLRHFFNFPVSWHTTSKEMEKRLTIVEIIKRYPFNYGFSLLTTSIMIVFGLLSHPYQIRNIEGIIPLAISVGCHVVSPLLLNYL